MTHLADKTLHLAAEVFWGFFAAKSQVVKRARVHIQCINPHFLFSLSLSRQTEQTLFRSAQLL